MAALDVDSRLVEFTGDNAHLLDLLREPISRALGDRRTRYHVQVESVGRVGEVVVTITGFKGRVPLFLGGEELEPGYVTRLINETISKYGL